LLIEYAGTKHSWFRLPRVSSNIDTVAGRLVQVVHQQHFFADFGTPQTDAAREAVVICGCHS
jgi:hypothetical protein